MRKWLVIALILATGAWAISAWTARVRSVSVAGGGDFNLAVSATPSAIGAVTLDTEDVHGLHLSQDGNAGGQKVVNVTEGVSTTEALVYGQGAGGDLASAYPNPTLIDKPIVAEYIGLAINGQTAGGCTQATLGAPGAATGMVAYASTRNLPMPPGITLSALVTAADVVGLRYCSIVDKSAVSVTRDLSVRVFR